MLAQLRSLASSIRALLNTKGLEERLHDELQLHADLLEEENVQRGMAPEEARRMALVALGGRDQIREEYRDERGFRWLEAFVRDAGHGFRGLGRTPGLTSIAISILALGIGANTAIFSLIDTMVFRPLPVWQPDRLVSVNPASFPDYNDIRFDNQVFSSLASYADLTLSARSSSSEILSGRCVSANFFQVLGLTMVAGRGFLPEEESLAGGRPVVVIGFGYWQRQFGGDPAVIGKTMSLNGESLTIVGVAPKDFRDLVVAGNQDVWVPTPMFGRVMHVDHLPLWREATENRELRWLSLVGRLKEGMTLAQARARIEVLAAYLRKNNPKSKGDWRPTLNLEDRARWPGRNDLFSYAILSGAAICILLLTCTNVANLLLARGSARRREIAVRFSLGASRSRVVRQLMAEGAVLSAAATVASLAICSLTLKILPAFRGAHRIPLVLEQSVDHRALLLAICIGLFTNLLFGLAPALVTSRTDVNSALKDQRSLGPIPVGFRFRRVLVVVQIALSVVLLITAGLFVRTILRFQAMDLGYDRRVLLLHSDSLGWGPDKSQAIDFYSRSLERIRALPGVRSASWAEDLPLDPDHLEEKIGREQPGVADEEWLSIRCNSITSGYFKTVGIPMLQGRDFTDQDNETAAGEVIVNESLARRYWPGAIPLGQRIRVKGRDTDVGAVPNRLCEVVGVVKDVKYLSLSEEAKPFAYFPHRQGHVYFHMDLHVSATGDPRSLVDPIRKACEAVNPKFAIYNARLMSAQLDLYLSQERSAAFIFGTLGPLSLLLAAIGLYGIISYSVTQRSHEFGIRVALGAQRKDILGLVLRDGMISTLLGLAIGLPASMALSRLIAGRLYGLSPLDPTTYIGISLICICVSTAATLLPARRASARPLSLLRSE